MKRLRPYLALLLAPPMIFSVLGCTAGNAKLVSAAPPDEAIEQTARSIADGRFGAAWRALPASYRSDLTEVIHQGAEEMDAELWNRTFTVLQKATRILREKRDFILEHPMLAARIEDRTEAESGWDSVVGLFDVVVNSDLADLNKVKRLDVEAFLGETGKQLWARLERASGLTPDDAFGAAMNDLRMTDATVLSLDGDTARVRIETPSKPAREVDYVRVEERWIPATLADGWDAMLEETRGRLTRLSGESGATNRQAVLMQLGMIESVLDNLQAAETAEEFHAGLGAAMGAVLGSAMTLSQSE